MNLSLSLSLSLSLVDVNTFSRQVTHFLGSTYFINSFLNLFNVTSPLFVVVDTGIALSIFLQTRFSSFFKHVVKSGIAIALIQT